MFRGITQKSSFNIQYSYRCRTISANWKPLKNHEKYFLFFILTNWLCYWQIRFCTYYAFSLNQMADIREVWKYWPTILFNFGKILQSRHFVVGEPKNLKLLADTSFESSLQNNVMASLLLLLCPCYKVDVDDIQCNEVASSTAGNFNNSWPLYLNIFKFDKFLPKYLIH